MSRIFYLCDGEKEDCKKNTCYKNGGGCKHTSNVKHALNFKRAGENGSFYEKEDAQKQEMQMQITENEAVDKWLETYRKNMEKQAITQGV